MDRELISRKSRGFCAKVPGLTGRLIAFSVLAWRLRGGHVAAESDALTLVDRALTRVRSESGLSRSDRVARVRRCGLNGGGRGQRYGATMGGSDDSLERGGTRATGLSGALGLH